MTGNRRSYEYNFKERQWRNRGEEVAFHLPHFQNKSEEEAEEYITAVKKKYWDARHNCYAYVTGDKGQIQRFSDDGEPQGTAGKPMLDILNSYGLTDCLLVVTRYFGGVLLGTGGLIRAYQAAAKEGIKNSDVAQVCDGITAVITTDYNAYGKLQYICNDNNVDIIDTDFGANVTIKLAAEMSVCDTFEKKLMDTFAGNVVLNDKENVKFCRNMAGNIIFYNISYNYMIVTNGRIMNK